MSIYESYQEEIRKIRRSGNLLLRKINRHETLMNQRKQRMIPATFTDCRKLYTMATTLIRMLAYIKSYEFFQFRNMLLLDENMDFFYQITNYNYQTYLRNFVLRLRELQSIDFHIQKNINYY